MRQLGGGSGQRQRRERDHYDGPFVRILHRNPAQDSCAENRVFCAGILRWGTTNFGLVVFRNNDAPNLATCKCHNGNIFSFVPTVQFV